MKHLALTLFLTLPAFAFERELSPDRPDTTESPFTVEPGHFQIEAGLWSFAKDGGNETWTLGETNLKAGLCRNADLHLVLRPWIHEQADDGSAEGFGDIVVRLKYNLWGNDGGKSAAALMPYVSVPTHTAVSTGEWEGGLILPVAIELTDRLAVAFQVDASRAWDSDSGEYDWDLLHSISLGISLTEDTGMFIEYVGVTGDGPYEAAGNVGFTWAATENLQWDVAVGVGLNDAAEDFSIAQGVTFRF
jgi:hypothetical protein